jgi:uncharacterized membrane protein YeaQ/YmgE (transglycosylase-associated protein family)
MGILLWVLFGLIAGAIACAGKIHHPQKSHEQPGNAG